MQMQQGVVVTPENESQDADTMLMRLEGNAIYVADQKPGKEIKATVVNLKSPGYVVVHEVDNGKPGKVVGNSDLLPAGEHQKVSITLGSSYEDGAKLIAMLHVDDGDSSFDAAKDAPAQDESGQTVMMEFAMSVDALENPEIAF